MTNTKKQLLHGFLWSALEKYSGLFVNIVVTMVLARLLAPEEFGVVAIATVLINFLSLLCTMGIGPAVIQRKDLDNNDLNDIFTFSICVGIFLALIFYLFAPLLSVFYGDDKLELICRILSINVFFAAANMVPNALLAKKLMFKKIAERTLLLQFSSGALSILFAFSGAGVYSLLISPIVTSIGMFLFNSFYVKLKIKFKFSLEPVRRIFEFSLFQFLFQFINFIASNIDKLIIGKNLTTAQLGYYQKSYQLVQLPVSYGSAVLNPVLQPVLSNFQDDKSIIANKYNRIVHFIATVSFPIGLMMFYCGPMIIKLFYGPQWNAAIPSFEIMSIAMPLQMIMAVSGSFFQSCNDTRSLFLIGLINSITTISSEIFAVMVIKSITAVAVAWAISTGIGYIVTYFFMYKVVLKEKTSIMLKELLYPFVIGTIIALIFQIENLLFPISGVFDMVIKIVSSIIYIVIVLKLTGQLTGIKSINK